MTPKKKSNEIMNSHTSDPIFVLDASAIYNGVLGQNIRGIKYIPECVLAEIKGMLRGEAIIEEALLYEDLKIISPSKESLIKIKKQAVETGDVQELSQCDLAVIALALDLILQKNITIILSDDYDIQNLANYIGITSKGIHWKGITTIHKYQWICPACGSKSKEKRDHCLECGTEMVRKTIKRKIRK
ncbi:MAG: hypothetical protein FK731_01250 [Asgard group archaeon]|nr:hypothetical protein [Asgard group archaeon]